MCAHRCFLGHISIIGLNCPVNLPGYDDDDNGDDSAGVFDIRLMMMMTIIIVNCQSEL